MKVEVLYFDGCPSHGALMPKLRELMEEAGVDVPVELRRVESVEAADRERFLGSPTLRIDGQDVDPPASERTDFGLKCRLYALCSLASSRRRSLRVTTRRWRSRFCACSVRARR